MKHLLTLIIAFLVITSVAIAFSNDKESSYHYNINTEEVPAIDPDEEYDDEDDYDPDFEGGDVPLPYYGDTLYQYDNKTLMYDYITTIIKPDSGMEFENYTGAVITYIDTVPVDTSIVRGNGTYIADGDILKFAIGVDTVSYDFKKLPGIIDPRQKLLSPGMREHEYSHSFSLSGNSCPCSFMFNAYLPKECPTWLNQFIATALRNDLQAMFLHDKGPDKILKEYYGYVIEPKKVFDINACAMTPEQIAEHYARVFEQLYRDDFTGEVDEDDSYGCPKYDYLMEIAPAWTDKDGKWATYRIYTYNYTMGIHGYMEEYYLTFDNKTGRILSYKEIIGEEAFPKAINLLEKAITEQKIKYNGYDESAVYSASLFKEDLSSNDVALLKENYNEKYYPRPALTNHGIVFSYQPYENGAFSEGILHYVIPYSKLAPKLKCSLSR